MRNETSLLSLLRQDDRKRRDNGILLTLFALLVLNACGGSGNSTGNNGGGLISQTPTPTLVSIVPSSAMAGSAAVTIQANGTNFDRPSVLQWNGSAVPTTFVNANQLTARVPSSDLVSVGTANVTISNSSSDGLTSAALTFTIAPALAPGTWVRALSYAPNDVAWDSVHGYLLASMPAQDSANPNTILMIDPISATVVTKVPSGNNPNLLSVS